MKLLLTSFAYQHGLPPEADLVFDVRFLKNPHYDDVLKPLSGLDEGVGEHIETDPEFQNFYQNLTGMIALMLPRYVAKPRSQFMIAVGCTGGQHRSVYIVQKLGAFFEQQGYNVTTSHRELKKVLSEELETH